MSSEETNIIFFTEIDLWQFNIGWVFFQLHYAYSNKKKEIILKWIGLQMKFNVVF